MTTDSDIGPGKRSVRSYVLRTGRITASQKLAFEQHWSSYGLEIDAGLLDPLAIFGRHAPLVIEIGFGMGESLLTMAQQEPDKDFIGVEVHTPGVGRLLNSLHELQINNVRIYRDDAIGVLQHCVESDSVHRLQLYFPDPWPKKKHHKRRIVQPDFVNLVGGKLAKGGVFHLATDWQAYAEHMLEVMEQSGSAFFNNIAGPKKFSARPSFRPITKFEQRGARLGHGVWDLLYQKN